MNFKRGELFLKKLIIIAGPSGAGKTTISNYLEEKYQIPRVLTHTTRAIRSGESKDAYYFENEESFAKLHLFESVKYGPYQYGSSREGLEKAWKTNDIVSLIVDTAGVKSYVEKLQANQFYFIYLKVSHLETLEERLVERGDEPTEILKRINSREFKRDLQLSDSLKKYAHVLVNDNLEETQRKIDKIITKLRKN
ncbi:guanylate kinase [Lactobacillus jensenii]|uniref:guanylate kinase n=1 Tax=Lactobacillus jensenii TaxID=109790 RepID=UPI001243D6A0|nr:AAA family ATPase [Lactobacillus jensenii]KAA9265256.1 guanylate kinase [Lactobacillus jensenii]